MRCLKTVVKIFTTVIFAADYETVVNTFYCVFFFFYCDFRAVVKKLPFTAILENIVKNGRPLTTVLENAVKKVYTFTIVL